MHSVKTKKIKSLILKLHLKKDYDKICWNYLRMMLIQIGLKWEVANGSWGVLLVPILLSWLMVLQLDFFKSYRGLRHGFPLSLLLLLSVVEGLSRLMKKACSEGKFLGIKVAKGAIISHLLFVDDVVILGVGSVEEWLELNKLLTSFSLASSKEVNC